MKFLAVFGFSTLLKIFLCTPQFISFCVKPSLNRSSRRYDPIALSLFWCSGEISFIMVLFRINTCTIKCEPARTKTIKIDHKPTTESSIRTSNSAFKMLETIKKGHYLIHFGLGMPKCSAYTFIPA